MVNLILSAIAGIYLAVTGVKQAIVDDYNENGKYHSTGYIIGIAAIVILSVVGLKKAPL